MINKKTKTLLSAVFMIPIVLLGFNSNVALAYTTQEVLGAYDFVSSYKQNAVSTSGRYVAFVSGISTLVPLDTNNRYDAFLKDTETGTVTLLSITPAGDSGNYETNNNIVLTGNGRYALFASQATDLASSAGGYNASNLYLRDIQTSTTYLIAAGVSSNTNNYPIGISEDGRFVYYNSSNQGNGRLYVFDRVLSTTERVDVDSSGNPANGYHLGISTSSMDSVSCDGRFVTFSSDASNLVSGDSNGVVDVFLADRMGGNTIKNITLNSNGRSDSPKISCDGNYILFWSSGSNLVSSDANAAADLFKYTVSTGVIERASLNDDDTEYAGDPNSVNGGFLTNGNYQMSMDGRYVFYIHAKRTSPSSSNRNNLMMRDMKLGTTTTIIAGGSNSYPWTPVASYDGRKVYYVSSTDSSGSNANLRVVTGHL